MSTRQIAIQERRITVWDDTILMGSCLNETLQDIIGSIRLICSASIADIDEQMMELDIPEHPVTQDEPGISLIFRCLTGSDCFTCEEGQQPTASFTRSKPHLFYEKSSSLIGIHLARPQDEAKYVGFLRALARLISGGSDERFCAATKHNCS